MNKINENKFYNALESIFTGASIEGDSGYVNLLKIKSSYFKLILEEFKKLVNNEKIITDSFKEEFFDKLYSFFEKYFSESGSVYFVKTANWQRVYEQVYTDNKDVVLFWKTHMLYYVKSDILFQSIDVKITDEESKQEYNFFFDVGILQAKQNNEKKSLIFSFKRLKEDKLDEEVLNYNSPKKTFIFEVSYSENGTKTKTDDIIKQTKIPESILEKAFATFKKQSEVDFFINKNAEKFLTEQLDMYLHQILLKEENKFEQQRLDQLKTIKTFALKIIKFISQFEDELVRIWNKPKFTLNSNYVITIDRLSEELLQKIANHSRFREQIAEWQELGLVNENFDFTNKGEKEKYLPIDTKYFKDLEIEILSLFDNIDKTLDGRFIHSENYQALNTLQKKYKEKIQCIYIDPPFNLGQNADFNYKVNYKDSNWATILENRIKIAHNLLSDTGSIFVRCDYNGNFIVRCLLDEIFGKENFRNEIIISKSAKLTEKINRYHSGHDSLFFYSKTNNYFFETQNKERLKRNWRGMHLPGIRWSPIKEEYLSLYSEQNIQYKNNKPTTRARIILGKELLPPENRHWALNQESIFKLEKENGIIWENNEPKSLEGTEQKLTDNWTDWVGYSSDWGFSTENHEKVLERAILTATKENDIVIDFFAGSATTQAVAQKLGRKWIGVEMGTQFFDTDLPRIKHVLFGKQSGISNSLKEKYKGGGIFKYAKLEQYEDTLRNMKYKEYNQELLFSLEKKAFEQYVFYADQKFSHILDLGKDTLDIDFDKLYPNIDFAETISNLLGLPIKRITKNSVILEDGDNDKEIKTDYRNMSELEKLAFVKLLKTALWWGE